MTVLSVHQDESGHLILDQTQMYLAPCMHCINYGLQPTYTKFSYLLSYLHNLSSVAAPCHLLYQEPSTHFTSSLTHRPTRDRRASPGEGSTSRIPRGISSWCVSPCQSLMHAWWGPAVNELNVPTSGNCCTSLWKESRD